MTINKVKLVILAAFVFEEVNEQSLFIEREEAI